MNSIRPFVNEDGYTPFSNYTLDVIMPSLPANAWKVLCFVLRKTQGWQKDMDRLSYGQIEEGTGISSSATISTAIKVLLEKNYIIQVPGSAWKPMGYRINSTLEIEEQETPDSTSIPEEQNDDSNSKSKAHSSSEIKVTSKIKEHSDLEIEVHSTSKIKDTTERSTEKKERGERVTRSRPPDVIFEALAGVCKIDWHICTKAQRDQLNQSVAVLRSAGLKAGKSEAEIADTIRYVASYFAKNDWRGKKGEIPTPAIIREVWGAAIAARASPTNGTNGYHAPPVIPVEELATDEDFAALFQGLHGIGKPHDDTSTDTTAQPGGRKRPHRLPDGKP